MAQIKSLVTKEELLEDFEYRDGRLYYLKDRNYNALKGSRAGSKCSNNNKTGMYWNIKYKGKLYLEHRLIFFMFHEYFPKYIDHISDEPTEEGIKSKRIENLREASNSLNIYKQRKRKNVTSTFRGVSWCKEEDRWKGQIMKNYKLHRLGYFKDEVSCAKAVNKKAKELFGKDAVLNKINGEVI